MEVTYLTVDLDKREVAHPDGARATFYEYWNRNDWIGSEVVMVHNPQLYPGPATEFARFAKEAALTAEMAHKR